jgi:hypothetical protein
MWPLSGMLDVLVNLRLHLAKLFERAFGEHGKTARLPC